MPDERFDVFVCYAQPDAWWAKGYLINSLEQAGLRVLGESAFRIGVPRVDEFERAVKSSDRTLLVLSPAFVDDDSIQFTRRLAQQYGTDNRTWPIIPLLLKPVENLDPSLRMLTSLDATHESDWPDVIARLCTELKRPVPQVSERPACPYPGMRPFREGESRDFFGRDRESRQLVEQHLRLYPFVAIIGASGTGKSSLAFAGLVPELQRSSFFGSGKWIVKSMRPGEAPIANMRKALPEYLAEGSVDLAQPDQTGDKLLFIVDQFEELYTFSPNIDRSESEQFQRLLLELSEIPDCYVVLTVRADFYGDLMQSATIWPEIRAHRFELTQLDREGLIEAITGPAEAAGVFIEPTLVQRLLADAGAEPGILPFLQETLVLLWNRLERRSLPLAAYDAIVAEASRSSDSSDYKFRSGLEVAMATRANQAMARLKSEEARAIARRIFLRLVQFGEGRSDTRRQQKVAQLSAADDDAKLFDTTLKHLVQSRLLTISGDENDANDTSVDIAHEALLTGWPLLANWISLRRDAEQTRRWLSELADKWLQRLKTGEQGGLLDEVELAEAERWREQFGAVIGRDRAIEQLIEQSRSRITQQREEEEKRQQRELEQQRQLTEEQRLRAEDAERFAAEQRQLNIELKRTAANNSFVQSMSLLDDDKGDRAVARLCQTLRLNPDHSAAATSLFALLTRRWYPIFTGYRFCPEQEAVKDLTYTPDGKYLIGYTQRNVYVWNAFEAATPVVLQHDHDIKSIQISKDSQLLLTSCTSYGEIFGQDAHVATGTIQLWNLATGERLHTNDVRGMVTNAIFGPNEERIYVASAFGPVALTSTLATAPETWFDSINKESYRNDNTPTLIAFDETGSRVVWIGAPQFVGAGEMYVWDCQTGKLLNTYEQDGFSDFQFGRRGSVAVFSGPLLPPMMRSGIGMPRTGFAGSHFLDDSQQPFYVQHSDHVNCLRINGAGSRAVSCSDDRYAQLWNPHDGKIFNRLEHDSAVTAAAFSPDGRLLVTGTDAGAVRIWSGWSGQPLSENSWQQGGIVSIVFSPYGHEFATSSTVGRLTRYDTACTVPDRIVIETGEPRMVNVQFLRDGARLLARSEDRIEVWSALYGTQESEFLVENKEAKIAAISNDQQLIAVRDDQKVSLREIKTGELVEPEILHDTKVRSVNFSSNDERLITVSEHQVKVSQIGKSTDLFSITLSEERLEIARELSNERLFVAGNHHLRIYNLIDGSLLQETKHNVESESNVLEDGAYVVKVSLQDICEVFVEETMNRLLVLYGHRGAYVAQPAYKGEFVIEDAQIWSLSPLQPLAPAMSTSAAPDSLSHYAVNNAVFADGATKVLSTSNSGDVNIWSSETGEKLYGPLQHRHPVFQALPSSDSQVFATSGRAAEVNLWNLQTGEPWGRPLIHDSAIKAVRFAGDSNVIVTWTERGAINFWDARTGLKLPDDIVVGPEIRSVDVGLSGDLVVTVNEPGVATIHRIRHKSLFEKLLPTLVTFAENLCGWVISKQGIEIRHFAVKSSDSDVEEAAQAEEWEEFTNWFFSPADIKPSFPGTVLPSMMSAAILASGNNALAYLVLAREPANAEAFMLLAEGVVSNDRGQISTIANFIGASYSDELLAVADLWSELALRLSNYAPEYSVRRKNVLRAISDKPLIG